MTTEEILALPHKIVNGTPVLLSDSELAQRQIEDNAFNGAILVKTINDAANAIDIKAGEVRRRYITSGPGQDATYLSKEKQAETFTDIGFIGTIPGLIQAEMDATGMTAQQACQFILGTRDAWLTIAANIERERRRGKINVQAATNLNSVTAALNLALAALDVL